MQKVVGSSPIIRFALLRPRYRRCLMTTFVWVIGCPRSGTTFLTRVLGMNTDLMFDEPETQPGYERYKARLVAIP